jgi:arylsulfatase A-like enzyme
MSRPLFLAAAALTLGSAAFTAEAAETRKPNIIVLLADDLGYGELGCQGNPEIPTPHIDSLARNGVRFTSGYVSAPYCCPSRAGLMTGRYQTRFGHERNVVGKTNLDPRVGLPVDQVTLADRLKTTGYATGVVGKWHLGGTPRYHPSKRGFDEFYGFLHEGHFYVPPPYRGVVSHLRVKEPPYDADNPMLRGTMPIVEKTYLTDAITREALDFIDRHQKEPFFLYVPYNAVHSPMQATVTDLKRFGQIKDEHRRVFAAMLSSLDNSVGAVLKKLRELNLEQDTLIFFLSDNGGPTAELTSSNRPLRGGKGQLWEGGIRIPFVIQWKGHLPAGKVDNRPVISLDIFPTSLAAAGAMPAKGQGLDGVDLLPYLTAKKTGAPHAKLFWRYGQNIALRQGKWKLVRQGQRGQKDVPFRLFDLDADISETTELSGKQPEVMRELHLRLERLNGEMKEPLW